jgi:hypothetical protein
VIGRGTYTDTGKSIQPPLLQLLGIKRGTHRQQGDLIGLLLFFQNNKSRLKTIRIYILMKHHAGSLLGSFFDPDSGGNVFL